MTKRNDKTEKKRMKIMTIQKNIFTFYFKNKDH